LQTIPSAVAAAVERFGDDEALVDGPTRLSFRQLASQVDLAALALLASGVQAGDRVALWAPNSADWVIMSFAVYAVGGVLVPLNTRYRGEEAGHVLRTSRARILFTVTELLGTDLVALLADVPGLEGLEEIIVLAGPVPDGCTPVVEFKGRASQIDRSELDKRRSALDAASPSDIIFTSGRPAFPKVRCSGTVPVCAPTWRGPNGWACAEGTAI
jgi:acyl-CoA synthetase (AMP-forming)/AMP-acid ligase II